MNKPNINQTLETIIEELQYALNTGDDVTRDIYIKNAIRFAQEAINPIPLPTIKPEDKARVAFEQIKERIDEAVNDGDAMGWKYALNDINNIVLGWEDELE